MYPSRWATDQARQPGRLPRGRPQTEPLRRGSGVGFSMSTASGVATTASSSGLRGRPHQAGGDDAPHSSTEPVDAPEGDPCRPYRCERGQRGDVAVGRSAVDPCLWRSPDRLDVVPHGSRVSHWSRPIPSSPGLALRQARDPELWPPRSGQGLRNSDRGDGLQSSRPILQPGMWSWERRIQSCCAAEGEAYRTKLMRLADALGVSANVLFVDRYVTRTELGTWLKAADIFVTPYPNREQIVSGTLAYAMSAGKAVVSTALPLRGRDARGGPRQIGCRGLIQGLRRGPVRVTPRPGYAEQLGRRRTTSAEPYLARSRSAIRADLLQGRRHQDRPVELAERAEVGYARS